MSTYGEIISRVDDARPNGYSEQTKLRWLAALEGKVAADVFLMDIAQIQELEPKWPEGLKRETLVSFPHDDIYDTWLEAKILLTRNTPTTRTLSNITTGISATSLNGSPGYTARPRADREPTSGGTICRFII